MSTEMLRQMIEQVVAQFHPQRVILFGSYATGQADEQSDVDLLVVSDEATPAHQQALAIRRSLGRFPVACDVIVKGPADFDRLRRVVNNIVYLANRYGKTVYER